MRLWVLMCLSLGLLTPASALADTLLTQSQFRDALLSRISAEAPTPCLEPSGETEIRFGLKPDDCEGWINIENAYRDYRLDPSSLRDIQSNFITMLAEANADRTPLTVQDRARLVPVVRHVDFLSPSPGIADGVSPTGERLLVYQPFVADMVILLALDSDTSLAFVGSKDLAELQMDEKAAFDMAVTNLNRRLGRVERENIEGIQLVTAESGLATGILTQAATCRTGQRDRYYFVFARDAFISVDPNQADAVGRFFQAAAGFREEGDTMSDEIIACSSGQWVHIGRPSFDPNEGQVPSPN